MTAFLLLPITTFASPRDELDQTRKDMETSKAKQEELAKQARKLGSELQDLQTRLVSLAESVQKSESELSATEDKLRILNEQQAAKSALLAARKKNLSALVQAALRLSRVPPEAVVMMPGDMAQTMKASRALKMVQDSIRGETKSIGLQLSELETLRHKMEAHRDEVRQNQQTLDTDRQALDKRLKERRTLLQQLGHQQQEEADKQAQLAKQAQDLEDLVTALQKQEKLALHPHKTIELQPEEGMAGKKGSLRSFASAKGHIRAPVAGTVKQSFGVSDGRNDTSKGIIIATRTGAQVTSPYDGEVVFAGPFLTYGRLIIIRHSDDFHTLIAGMTKIDVAVGQFLLEGEPIGAMGEGGSGGKLYFELRKNNQPTDPAPWISGLKKSR